MVADIELEHEHDYPVGKARDKADQLLQGEDRIESVTWNEEGTIARIKGTGFTGQLELSEGLVRGEIELSMMARPFKQQIEQALNEKLEKLLS